MCQETRPSPWPNRQAIICTKPSETSRSHVNSIHHRPGHNIIVDAQRCKKFLSVICKGIWGNMTTSILPVAQSHDESVVPIFASTLTSTISSFSDICTHLASLFSCQSALKQCLCVLITRSHDQSVVSIFASTLTSTNSSTTGPASRCCRRHARCGARQRSRRRELDLCLMISFAVRGKT